MNLENPVCGIRQVRARLLAQKAEAYYGLGLIDECAFTAEEALTMAQSVGSNKTVARVRGLHASLRQSQWRKERSTTRLGALLSRYAYIQTIL